MNHNSLIADRLNLGEYAGQLLSVGDKDDSARLKYFRGQARLVDADHFYVVRNELENALVPFIYVYDERGKSEKKRRNLFEISKKLWTVGEVAAAIVVYNDELKIIDARRPPDGKNDAPAFLGNLASYADIDRQLRSKLFEGHILEEAGDYVSLSPYQYLLRHIDKNILSKVKEIGCPEKTLKKLTVKLILAKYLEEQTDDKGTAIPLNVCSYLKPNRAVELFDELNARLNGGVFDLNEDERADIAKANLTHIANALDGGINPDGQREFWKIYDFNLIPIEFISRLYERFVISIKDDKKKTRKDGAYYTPPHLARLMVDELLPFDLDVDFKNFKVLDPSCGSGIFLVLAYKRLITLWMLKNGKKKIEGQEDIQAIKGILNNCIYGVDINGDALAITATSLQIELTSHVQPKEIWPELKFDNLLKQGNLQEDGFFKWYKQQRKGGIVYDVILGNPPFNVDNESDVEKGWDDSLQEETFVDIKGKDKTFPYKNPAIAILYHSAHSLLKSSGCLSMVMPASSFLYMPSSKAFREVFFAQFDVQKVYDFTPLMSHLWGQTKIATVSVVVKNNEPKNGVVEHIVVRNTILNEKGALRFEIDKYDRFSVPYTKIRDGIRVWKTNLFGGGRLELHNNRYLSNLPTVKDYLTAQGWDKYSTGFRTDRSASKQINLKGWKALISERFNSDRITQNMLSDIGEDNFKRPPNGSMESPPNVLIRLNLNHSMPIAFNTQKLAFFPGILGLKCDDPSEMKAFVEAFKNNRELYKRLIRLRSVKAFVQQAGDFSIDAEDVLNLPIALDDYGLPRGIEIESEIEKAVWHDVDLMTAWLQGESYQLLGVASSSEIQSHSSSFCEILNHVYEKGDFKFRPVRQMIDNDLVWVTYEHSDVSYPLETTMTEDARSVFSRILADDVSNNGLRINRVITYYEEKNRVSFIKPNRLKYWTRSIGYRDAENVKGDMFNHGY